VAAFLLLRYAIWQATGRRSSVGLVSNQYRKPYLKDLPFYFNLTHTGNLAACGISNMEIGIDAEEVFSVTQGVASLVFSPEEQREWKRSAQPDWYFSTVWTRKESYLKQKGTGLHGNLKALNFGGKKDRVILLSEGSYIVSRKIGSCMVSVCSAEQNPSYERVDFHVLKQFLDHLEEG